MQLLTAGPDSDIYLGWFSSDSKDKEPAEVGNFLGVHVGGPTRIGHYFSPAFTTAKAKKGKVENGPVLVPGKILEWSVLYDPTANNANGEINVTLGEASVTLPLKPGQKAEFGNLDRFGFFNSTIGGQMVKIYLDDLSYTAWQSR